MDDGRDYHEVSESQRRLYLRRLLRMPAWRAGVGLLIVASAFVYVTALALDALVAQVFAAFAGGGAAMISCGRESP